MTATTKEILGQFASLYEGVTTAIPRPRDYRDADRDRLFHLVLTELPSLLSDSDRLAAIEAVTGEEVRELVDRCQEHLTMSKFLRKEHLLARANDDRELSATAILSLSAKVAEQAEEIERLKSRCQEMFDERNQILRDSGYEQFDLIKRAEAAEAKCNVLSEEVAQLEEGYTDIKVVGLRVRSHYDTIRRLLTETAVPALSNIQTEPSKHDAQSSLERVMWARDALSTIRAQMENSTDSPRPARCSTCDDTRIIYGHGGVETSCPACYASDAEAGLAMLGGDGRG